MCQRTIGLLPAIKLCVAAVVAQACYNSNTKSYGVVADKITDVLLPAKFTLYFSVTNQSKPFFPSFQTNMSVIPFLCTAWHAPIRKLVQRCVKLGILKRYFEARKRYIICKEHLCDYTRVDVSFNAGKILRNLLTEKNQWQKRFGIQNELYS
jgi:hypothetical protein